MTMNNLKNFAIDMTDISMNFAQMRNATMVAVKEALYSTVIIADQVMVQSNAKKMHVKTADVEIIVGDGNVMVISKDHTIVSDIDTIASMEFELVNFSFSQLTELLDALAKLGKRFQKGGVEFDTEFVSKGLDLSNEFLNLFKNSLEKHVNYKSHDIVIDNNSITMDGKVLLQGKIFYYYEWATRVLIDLMGMISVKEENKYDVLFGGKPFSNEGDDIKEWPCKHA